MKIHKTTIKDTEIKSWNDSNSSWVVEVKDLGSMSFDKRKFTMKAAIEFYCELKGVL